MIAAVRRSAVGAWHLVPVVKRDAGDVVPIASTLCERFVGVDELHDVVAEPELVADLLAGVECCRPCRQLGEALEVTS